MIEEKIVLELDEKLWFGKYKGRRLVDVIESDAKYINKMVSEYNVELSEDALNYYGKSKNDKYKHEVFFSHYSYNEIQH